MHEAHSARILSDILWSQFFRLNAAYKFLGKKTDDLNSFVDSDLVIWRTIKSLEQKWSDIEYG